MSDLASNSSAVTSVPIGTVSGKDEVPIVSAEIVEVLGRIVKAGFLTEASELSEFCARRYIGYERALFTHAVATLKGGDFLVATELFSLLRRDFPGNRRVYVYESVSLRKQKKFKLADSVIESAMTLFPDSAAIFDEYAEIASVTRGDLEEAIRRWETVRAKFPEWVRGYLGLARALSRIGRLAEADQRLQEALDLYPKNETVLFRWAQNATLRKEWSEAQRRWVVAKSHHPTSELIASGVSDYLLNIQLEQDDPAASAMQAHEADQPFSRSERLAVSPDIFPATEDIGQFFLQFESLGDNCEFGIVQRIAGIEPLGFLRWSSITLDKLIELLRNNFEGVGLSENTSLDLSPSGRYSIRDVRYFGMHTFLNQGQSTPEKLKDQMCRRLVFLKDKFVSDLEEGEKIFVIKTKAGKFQEESILELYRLMTAFGSHKLLCVQSIPDASEDDAVRVIGKGIMVRNISKMTADPHGAKAYFEEWVKICLEAREFFGRN